MTSPDAGSRLKAGVYRFHRGLATVENGLALAAGFAIVAATILGVTEIFGRSLLNLHVPGYIDLIEYLAAIFAFLGLAYCQRLGGHVGMDLLTSKLPRQGKHWGGLVDTLIGLVFIAVLFTAAWSHFDRAFYLGDSSMIINLPMWPAKLLIPIAFAFWLLRLLVQALGYVIAIVDGATASDLIPPDPHAAAAVRAAAIDARVPA